MLKMVIASVRYGLVPLESYVLLFANNNAPQTPCTFTSRRNKLSSPIALLGLWRAIQDIFYSCLHDFRKV